MFYNRNHKGYQTEARREFAQPVRNYNYKHELDRTNYGFESYNRFDLQQYDVPCADILELDDQFVLELALPGVVLDDVELKIEGNFLTVIAKRTPTMFEEKASYLRRELPATLMIREFEFETEILWENVEARLDRGLLFISLPKVEAAIRIPVSHGSIEGHVSSTKTRTLKTEVRSHKEITIK
jgi:HSP20 family molecular chaperone IbpA